MDIKGKIKFRLNRLFKKEIIVPSMDEKRGVIAHWRKEYEPSVLVETGTFLGDTVAYFKNDFEKIYSIELSEELAKKAQERFAAEEKISILHGDSGEMLLSVGKSEGTVMFWLDGHYSSEFFIGDQYIRTAKGERNTPIEKELDIILRDYPGAIILIDDARLFTGKEDYPSMKKIRERIAKVKGYKPVFTDKDIIHILPERS